MLFGRLGDALEQLGGIDVHVPTGLVAVDQVVREDVDFHFLGFLDLNFEWHLGAHKLDGRAHAGKEGHVLDDDGRVLETIPTCRASADAADGVLDSHDAMVVAVDVRLGGKHLAQHAKTEVAHVAARLVDGVDVVLRRQLTRCHQVANDLAQVGINALVDLKAQVQAHAEQEVRAKGLDGILVRIGLVGNVHVDEPVCLGALGMLVQDGVEHVAVEREWVGAVGEKYQIVGEHGVGLVIAQAIELVDVLGDGQQNRLRALDGGAAAPHIHKAKQQRGQKDHDVAAVKEHGEARSEEAQLNGTKEQGEDAGTQLVLEDAGDVARQKRRGHEHGHGNGEAIGALHAFGVLEQQHDEDAADPHDVVDERNIELALGVAGVVDAQMRHKVETRGLGYQRERAGDERLRGDDGRYGRKHDGKGAQGLGKHHIERVDDVHREHLGIGVVGEQTSALTQIVKDKGHLYERPGCIDVGLAHMTHVRIERLGAGR